MSRELDIFSEDEWEMLCDNCGLCCLYKLQDEDTGELYFTSVLCPYLNKEDKHCVCYPERFEKMPTCTKISPESLPRIARWLPKNCAYRCVFEGIALPDWHPLNRDDSMKAAALRQKLKDICLRPNTCISKETADLVIHRSRMPRDEQLSPRRMTRLLLNHIIEDIDL